MFAAVTVINQGGVQVDSVRHNRSPQHGGGHQNRIRPLKRWNHPLGGFAPVRWGHHQSTQKAESNNDQQRNNCRLKVALGSPFTNSQQSNRGNTHNNASS